MSYYTQVLRQRVRQALTSLVAHAHRARDLAAVLRELASDLHVPVPVDLRTEASKEGIDVLRQRVRQALTSLLAVERTHFARELAMIFRELADELDPPPAGPRGDDDEGNR
jgi:hypothetical protein